MVINISVFFKSTLAVIILTSFGVSAQKLNGAWKLVRNNSQPVVGESIKIFSDNYFMFAMRAEDGAFIKAGGGTYEISGSQYTEVPDFDTTDSTKVRTTVTHSFSLSPKKDKITIVRKGKSGNEEETWERIDDSSSALSGAWRFGARVNEEGVAGKRRGSASPRQTMKILSGKYFQWAAFNYETGEFSGTGGGIYQLQGNKYSETIRFFSRDNSRVGMSLTFECRLDGPDWYHKGKGTTGNPVSEVWEKIR